jgi:fibronectin-binding autotransporter adhesin
MSNRRDRNSLNSMAWYSPTSAVDLPAHALRIASKGHKLMVRRSYSLILWTCIIGVLFFYAAPGRAQTSIWTGVVGPNWSTPGNWDTAPSNGAALSFGGNNQTSNNNDLSLTSIGGITFSTTAGNFVLGGNTITLTGGILNQSVNPQSITAPITLLGNLQMGQDVGAGGTVTLGSVSDGGAGYGITKVGSGTVVLSGAVNYSGATTINGGTLLLQPLAAPPVAGSAIWFDASQGATLTTNSAGQVTAWATAPGSGQSGTATVQGTSGTYPTLVPGGIAGKPAVQFSAASGQWLLTNNAYTSVGTQVTVFVLGQKTSTAAGSPMSFGDGTWEASQQGVGLGLFDYGTPYATHNGAGTAYAPAPLSANVPYVLAVSDTAAATAGLRVWVNGIQGTPVNDGSWAGFGDGYAKKVSLGAELSAQWWTDPIVNNVANANYDGYLGEVLIYNSGLSNAQVQAVTNYLTAKWMGIMPSTTPVSLSDGGTLDLGGNVQTIGALSSSDPTTKVSLGTGTLTVGKGASGSYTFAGTISGPGTLATIGTGNLVLSGSSAAFTGTTRLDAGTLTLDHPMALSQSTVDPSGGGTLSFGSLAAATVGGLQGIRGTVSLASTATAPVTLTVGNNNQSTTFGGTISGSGSLVKTGTGTLVLTGPNSYTGATVLEGGTLRIQPLSAPPVAGNAIWFDATQPGTLTTNTAGQVLAWAPAAGSTQMGTATSQGAAYPTYAAAGINGKPAVLFTAANLQSLIGTANVTPAMTVFAVGQKNTNNGNGPAALSDGTWYSWGNGNSMALLDSSGIPYGQRRNVPANGPSAVAPGVPYVMAVNDMPKVGAVNGTLSTWVNGVQGTTVSETNGYMYASYMSIGSQLMANHAPTNYYDGYVGEVLVYATSLSNAQMQAVNNYLLAKWVTGVMPTTSPVSLSGGATFDLAGNNQTIGALSSSDPSSTVALGSGTLTVGNGASGSYTFTGTLSGSGNLVTAGSGNLILSGSNATFTGTTLVNSGTLTLDHPTALAQSTVDPSGGGTLRFGAVTAATLGGLQGAGSVALTNSASTAVALTVGNNNQSTSFAGSISGSGSLVKTGSGTLVLTGYNSYSGGTTLAGGTLRIQPVSAPLPGNALWFDATQFATLTTNTAGQVLAWAPAPGSTQTSTATVQGTSGSYPSYSSTGLNGKPAVLFSAANSQWLFDPTYTNSAAQVSVFFVGQKNSSNGNGPVGSTYTYNWGGGFGYTDSDTGQGWGTFESAGVPYMNHSGFTASAAGPVPDHVPYVQAFTDVTLDQAGTAGAATIWVNGVRGQTTPDNSWGFGGNNKCLSLGSQVQSGSAAPAVWAPYDGYLGEVIIYNTALTAAQVQAVTNYLENKWMGGVMPSSGPVSLSGGAALDLDGNNQIVGTLSSSDPTTSISLGSGTLTVGNGTGGSYTFAGTISGTGNLVVTGSGTFVLAGSNTFSGSTTVNSGWLTLANPRALQNSTLTLPGTVGFGTLTAVSLGGLQGTSGSLPLLNAASAAVALSVSNDGTTSIAATLSGSGSLNKLGAGTMIVAGSNSYSGGTILSVGTLQLANSSALGSGGLAVNGGTLDLGGFSPSVGALSGAGLVISSSGTASLATNYSGTSIFAATMDSSVNLLQQGPGTLIVAGTCNGMATVSTGVLQIGDGGANGNITGDIVTNGAVVFRHSDTYTYAGQITGTGTLSQAGSGILILTNTGNVQGNTALAAGELSVSSNSNLGPGISFSGGLLQVTGTAMTNLDGHPAINWDTFNGGFDIVDGGNQFTVTGAPGGAGSLTKTGSGALVLANVSAAYLGGTTVQAGLLQVGDGTSANGSLGGGDSVSGNVTLSAGTTLRFANPFEQLYNGAVSGSGSVIKSSGGTLVMGGSSTFTGGLTVNSGTLQLADPSALGPSGAAVTLSGGTLDLGGVNPAVGTLNSGPASTIELGAATLTVGDGDASSTLAGTIHGAGGGLAIHGTGTTVLAGSNNYSGVTGLADLGRLSLANSQALSMSTLDYGSAGGSLDFGSLTAVTLGGLAGTNYNITGLDNRLRLTNASGTAVTLSVGNNGQDTAFSGDILGSGSLVKIGGGTVTLSGTDSYTGGTTVLGGTLDIAGVSALPGNSTLGIANTAEVIFATDLGSAIQLSLMLPGAGGGAPGLMYFHVTNSVPASVPEPGTLVLLAAAALAGLAAWRRRRKAAN